MVLRVAKAFSGCRCPQRTDYGDGQKLETGGGHPPFRAWHTEYFNQRFLDDRYKDRFRLQRSLSRAEMMKWLTLALAFLFPGGKRRLRKQVLFGPVSEESYALALSKIGGKLDGKIKTSVACSSFSTSVKDESDISPKG